MGFTNMIRVVFLYVTVEFVVCELCSQVLTLDCEHQYQAAQEEGVCGTNGVSYINYCYYAKAKCTDRTIDIQYVGLCETWNTSNETGVLFNKTALQENVTSNVFDNTTVLTSRTLLNNSTTDIGNNITTFSSYYSQQTRTTTKPINFDPIRDTFCTGVLSGTIKCPETLDPYCGTDGKFYLNSCSFEMAKCTSDGLSKQALEMCKGQIPTASED